MYEHKTRVLSCYVHGGKIERMYHRVNLLVHSKCHVDVHQIGTKNGPYYGENIDTPGKW
jgi:hypothetical protein